LNNGFNSGLTNGIVPRLVYTLELTANEEGFLNASLFCGGFIGCICGAILNDLKGRRWTTMFGEVIIILGTIGQLVDENLYSISIFRIIAGFGFGICAVTKPLYVSELADTKVRGFFVAVFCVAFSLGIQLVNMFEVIFPDETHTEGMNAHIWRFEIAASGIPAIALLTLVTFALPESPVWLEQQRQKGDMKAETPEVQVEDGGEVGEASKLVKAPASKEDCQKAFFYASIATLAMSIVHQMTLIAVIMGLTKEFIERVGVPTSESNLWVFAVGGTHLAGVLTALPLIDSWGRRPLLFTGYATMFVALTALAGVEIFVSNNTLWELKLFLICVFVFGFQIGPSPTYYTLISELFPYKQRAVGNGFGTALIFMWCIVVMGIYPSTKNKVSIEGIALFNLGVIASNGIVLWFLLPETKGVPLDKVTAMWLDHIPNDATSAPLLLSEPKTKKSTAENL